MLPLRPDMASLTVGSNNFPTRVYENPPDLVDWLASEMLTYDVKPEIEAFDLSHIFQAAEMAADGRLKSPLYVQFVMGVKNAMPADKPAFDFYVETLKRLAPDAEWCAAGIGPEPDRAERMVRGRGRALPHGARGQRADRQDDARARRTPRWCGGWWSCARSTSGPWRHVRRRGRCWGCGRRDRTVRPV